MIAEWRSSIAQADLADWVTVAAYLLAASLAARAAGRAALARRAGDRLFWRLTASLLVLLGINELLDLQTLLTSVARAHAKSNGWYEQRRSVQYAFVMMLAAGTVLAGIATLWLTRYAHPAVRLALAGLGFIGLFIVLRAASFHHLDELLGRGSPRFNWGSLQEMAGILLVGVAATLYLRRPSHRQ
jgi:hypothetical protein